MRSASTRGCGWGRPCSPRRAETNEPRRRGRVACVPSRRERASPRQARRAGRPPGARLAEVGEAATRRVVAPGAARRHRAASGVRGARGDRRRGRRCAGGAGARVDDPRGHGRGVDRARMERDGRLDRRLARGRGGHVHRWPVLRCRGVLPARPRALAGREGGRCRGTLQDRPAARGVRGAPDCAIAGGRRPRDRPRVRRGLVPHGRGRRRGQPDGRSSRVSALRSSPGRSSSSRSGCARRSACRGAASSARCCSRACWWRRSRCCRARSRFRPPIGRRRARPSRPPLARSIHGVAPSRSNTSRAAARSARPRRSCPAEESDSACSSRVTARWNGAPRPSYAASASRK